MDTATPSKRGAVKLPILLGVRHPPSAHRAATSNPSHLRSSRARPQRASSHPSGHGSADRGEILRHHRHVAGVGDQRDVTIGTDQHESAIGCAIGPGKMACGVGDVVGPVGCPTTWRSSGRTERQSPHRIRKATWERRRTATWEQELRATIPGAATIQDERRSDDPQPGIGDAGASPRHSRGRSWRSAMRARRRASCRRGRRPSA